MRPAATMEPLSQQGFRPGAPRQQGHVVPSAAAPLLAAPAAEGVDAAAFSFLQLRALEDKRKEEQLAKEMEEEVRKRKKEEELRMLMQLPVGQFHLLTPRQRLLLGLPPVAGPSSSSSGGTGKRKKKMRKKRRRTSSQYWRRPSLSSCRPWCLSPSSTLPLRWRRSPRFRQSPVGVCRALGTGILDSSWLVWPLKSGSHLFLLLPEECFYADSSGVRCFRTQRYFGSTVASCLRQSTEATGIHAFSREGGLGP